MYKILIAACVVIMSSCGSSQQLSSSEGTNETQAQNQVRPGFSGRQNDFNQTEQVYKAKSSGGTENKPLEIIKK